MQKRRLDQRINRLPLTRTQKEYVKAVMAQHDRPGSKGVTRDEFIEGLESMEKNTQDAIKRRDIEKIKEHFSNQ